LDSKAKELAEKHYRLVKEIMKKYRMSEYDTPDWHGALSEGLCVAAKVWSVSADSALSVGVFEEFAVPYMIVAAIKERPLQAVLGKVLAMRDDLSAVQECLLYELCFEEGNDETISVLTVKSEAVLNGQPE